MARIVFVASFAISAALCNAPAMATSFTTIWNFEVQRLAYPNGPLHFDGTSLFGTGSGIDDGKAVGAGQVFELTNSGGTWSEASIVKFNGTGGANPIAGLIQDSGGVLYGTTAAGGTDNYGTVFSLTNSGGSWVHKVLWNLAGTDGAYPECDPIMDSSGNLYLTTLQGGKYNYGTVLELMRSGTKWSEKVLLNFNNGRAGANPVAGLVMDSYGVLYGTTLNGGSYGKGIVFQLTGTTEKVLHNFTGLHDGGNPSGVLIIGSSGGLHGTTEYGGNGYGVVFNLTQSGGKWSEKVLYAFGGGTDGAFPVGGPHWGTDESTIYGTAAEGGTGDGTVYKLSFDGTKWTETTLHKFGGADGLLPTGAIILDSSGNLYGTTELGGTHGYGTVWEITP